MAAKILSGKKITLREINARDLRRAKEFMNYINSFVDEEAMLSMNKKYSLKQEREFLKGTLKSSKNKKIIFLIAENDKKEIIGVSNINLMKDRQERVGNFGISIKKDFRGIGLGKFMMAEIIKLSKRKLKPKPKIIRLSVFKNNKPAVALYQRMGFHKVAEIPSQLSWKGKLIAEVIMLLYLK